MSSLRFAFRVLGLEPAYSVSVKLIQGILAAADSMALSVPDLLLSIGLSAEITSNSDSRLPHRKFVALWHEIGRQTQDPGIGMRLAELTRLETFNVTGYAMSHSPTLGKALDRLVRYSRLLYEGMEFTLTQKGNVVHLSYGVVNAALPLPAISVGWSLANIVLWARRSLGTELPLSQVMLKQSVSLAHSTYNQIFRAPLTFDAPINALLFDVAWLDRPLINADAGLCQLLDDYAESLLIKLPPSGGIITQLQHLMAESPRGQEPKLEVIAAQMGYAPRTLQRKLQEEGTSFQQVLDMIRKELAYQYLLETSLTISEIAFLLGFSENSAFNRAFRRWTATTPKEYRRKGFTPSANKIDPSPSNLTPS